MSTLATMLAQDFAFAHGRLGVLQQFLLTQSDIDRLLGSPSFVEAERFLSELKLTDPIPQALSRADDILLALSQWIREEVERMAPEEKWPIFSILWLEGDGPLLAYLMKQKRGFTSAISREPVSPISAYRPSVLRSLVEENDEDALPPSLVAFVRSILAEEHSTPQQIDTRTAQCIADLQLSLARRSGSLPISAYVRHGIDLQNIRTSLRLIDSSPQKRLSSLLTGGAIPPQEFTESRTHLAAVINRSSLSYHLSEILDKAAPDVNTLERGLGEVLAADISAMWNTPLSIEPVFAFAALTLAHLRLLRALLIGKSAGYSPQEIKRMLPPFIPASHYVL